MALADVPQLRASGQQTGSQPPAKSYSNVAAAGDQAQCDPS